MHIYKSPQRSTRGTHYRQNLREFPGGTKLEKMADRYLDHGRAGAGAGAGKSKAKHDMNKRIRDALMKRNSSQGNLWGVEYHNPLARAGGAGKPTRRMPSDTPVQNWFNQCLTPKPLASVLPPGTSSEDLEYFDIRINFTSPDWLNCWKSPEVVSQLFDAVKVFTKYGEVVKISGTNATFYRRSVELSDVLITVRFALDNRNWEGTGHPFNPLKYQEGVQFPDEDKRHVELRDAFTILDDYSGNEGAIKFGEDWLPPAIEIMRLGPIFPDEMTANAWNKTRRRDAVAVERHRRGLPPLASKPRFERWW